jgi:hypothetical protein
MIGKSFCLFLLIIGWRCTRDGIRNRNRAIDLKDCLVSIEIRAVGEYLNRDRGDIVCIMILSS